MGTVLLIIDPHDIVWPTDLVEAQLAAHAFVVHVVDILEVPLPKQPNDALQLADGYLTGEVSMAQTKDAASRWWEFIHAASGLFDLYSKPMVEARISLSLLIIEGHNHCELSEKIGWFIEFLRSYGADHLRAVQLMKEWFAETAPSISR